MSVLCSGSFVADIMIPDLPEIGPPGSLTYAPSGITLSPGGHSANVSIDLAQLGQGSVHAIGSIGNDMIGSYMVEQLEERKVTVHTEIHDSTTAKNVALLVEGEDRRFIAELTANSLLTSKYLKSVINEVEPKVFYQGTLGGLPDIEINLINILELSHAKKGLNFVDVIMPTSGWEYLERAYNEIDIFHCNTDEGLSLTGISNPHLMIDQIIKKGVHLAIISDGARGVTAGFRDTRIYMPAFQVTQRDATGTGDALCAGIISEILNLKLDLETILNAETLVSLLLKGQATGAACVTGVGATTNVFPKRVEDILQDMNTILENTVVTLN